MRRDGRVKAVFLGIEHSPSATVSSSAASITPPASDTMTPNLAKLCGVDIELFKPYKCSLRLSLPYGQLQPPSQTTPLSPFVHPIPRSVSTQPHLHKNYS
ncbi:hypothetical protein Pst134EB_004045 [Puccinia striiformis f. sp. tritici]|nr:hypothetical protein Pst134EB_004045 [Puccinia striiformis f. sp. tritici]